MLEGWQSLVRNGMTPDELTVSYVDELEDREMLVLRNSLFPWRID